MAWTAIPGKEPEGARRDVEAAGGRALILPVDVADAGAVEDATARAERELGPTDVWVNAAMSSVFSPVREMTADEFRRVTEVTYPGYVHGTLAALRRMLPREWAKNLALPERSSVRTATQWTAGPSGGFSGAAPEDLARPAITAGPFRYGRMNVALQRPDPGTLLNRIDRLIRTRWSYPEFGRTYATSTTPACRASSRTAVSASDRGSELRGG